MTNLQHFSIGRVLRQAILGYFVLILLSALLAANLHAAADEAAIKPLVGEMCAAGGKSYNPQPLLDHGFSGLRVVLDEVFPETADIKKESTTKLAALVEQLGDASFERREAATGALRRLGPTCIAVLRQAANHDDAEVRLRVRLLIAEAEKSQGPLSVNPGLEMYLAKLNDAECQQELARRVTKALAARLDQSQRQEALRTCLQALAKWPSDRVHGELLPLLKLDDPKPAIFALDTIASHTGNEYVSALHMGAIASSNMELVRCAFRALPCPVCDEKKKPKIQAVLTHFFDDSPEYAELRKDSAFVYSMAFIGARDFRMSAARRWLIDKIKGGSLEAMNSFGDTYYNRDPLDQELLTALEPHLKSTDPKFRTVAVRTLGVYTGKAVQPALLRALADHEKQVWQIAGERLREQHLFYDLGQSPIPKLLESALQKPENDGHRVRAEFLLKHLQQEQPGDLNWPENE